MEPSEIDYFNECGWHESDFVDHDHNYATRCRELSEEKFDSENLNTEDYNSEYSQNRIINCNDLSKALQINTVKNEPCEIDVFTKCGRYCNSYNNQTDVDHDHSYATHSCQELTKEKLYMNQEETDHSEYSNNSATSGCIPTQFKNEDYEKSSEFIRFCEECHPSFDEVDNEIDFIKFIKYRPECRCQKQNKSLLYDIRGEDMTHDLKPSSLWVTTDSGLQLLKVQDEVISEGEVTEERKASAIPWRLSMPCIRKNQRIKRKLSSKTLENKVSVEQHITMEEKKINCKSSKFSSHENNLKIHETIHTGELFHCKVCSKSFSRSSSLIVHERSHNSCKVCSRTFTNSGGLKLHERIHTERPFQCKVCLKSFSQMGHLKIHEKSHSGEKAYHCKVCSKYFILERNLIVHERGHAGENPFHCQVCSRTFTNSGGLKLHERIHIERQFISVQSLLKSFSQMGHSKIHKSHTGKKAYQCKVCSRCFILKRNLIVHERGHAR